MKTPLRAALVIPALVLAGLSAQAQTPINPTQVSGGAGVRPPEPPKFGTDRLVTSAVSLTGAVHAPGDATRMFVTEQRGRILILDLGTNTFLGTPFLDIDSRVINTGNERGLLGLAFHPNYASNGLFYVNYSRNTDGDTVVAEYQVTANPNVADFNSERILLTIDQPNSNHNGGWMGFSPLDDYLYIATGDGGNFCDTGTGHTSGIGNAQDLTKLLGKMLRIDPLGGIPYGVPASNPFVGVAGADEIWAYGLRNPWRASFDRDTGDLYVGDVGQDIREEVDFQPGLSIGGENYGWRCREGFACASNGASGCPSTTGCTCPTEQPTLTSPVHDYSHAGNPGVCTVIGGYVYRGSALPQLHGRYFFADYCSGDIWSFRLIDGVKQGFRSFKPDFSPSLDGFNINSIQSFGEDANGELYIVTSSAIFKIVPVP